MNEKDTEGKKSRKIKEFKTEDLREIMEAEYAPETWLVDDLVPLGSIALITADPGSFKTYLVLHLALCVSETDIDIAQEILLLTRDIHRTYTKASLELKRQYLAFFWERFEVANGVIVTSVSTPLFAELLAAEGAFYKSRASQKDHENNGFSEGILGTTGLRMIDDVRTYTTLAR